MTDLETDGRYWRGIHLFNAGSYFECHEVLEEIWTCEHGPNRLFLQGLIHFAVALHHYERSNPDGARRQLRKGLKKLAGYLPRYRGLDTLSLYSDGLRWRDSLIAGGGIEGLRQMKPVAALQSQVRQ